MNSDAGLNDLERLVSEFEEKQHAETQDEIEEKISFLRITLTDRNNALFRELRRRYNAAKRKPKHFLHPELMPVGGEGGSKENDLEINLDIMAHGRQVQKASEEKLRSIVQTTDRAKELAAMTSQQLAEHMEKIASMGEVLDEIEPILVRANRHMRRISRAIVCNKYLWVLIFLILVGIGAIIYLKRVN